MVISELERSRAPWRMAVDGRPSRSAVDDGPGRPPRDGSPSPDSPRIRTFTSAPWCTQSICELNGSGSRDGQTPATLPDRASLQPGLDRRFIQDSGESATPSKAVPCARRAPRRWIRSAVLLYSVDRTIGGRRATTGARGKKTPADRADDQRDREPTQEQKPDHDPILHFADESGANIEKNLCMFSHWSAPGQIGVSHA